MKKPTIYCITPPSSTHTPRSALHSRPPEPDVQKVTDCVRPRVCGTFLAGNPATGQAGTLDQRRMHEGRVSSDVYDVLIRGGSEHSETQNPRTLEDSIKR